MDFKGLIIGLLLVSLALLSLVNFGVFGAIDNNANQSIISEENCPSCRSIATINETLYSRLVNASSDAQGSRTSLEEEQVDDNFSENAILISIRFIMTGFTSIFIGLYNVTFGLIFDTLIGGDDKYAPIFTTFLAILLISVILLVWKTIRSGS